MATNLALKDLPFWIQVHGLAPNQMNPINAKAIDNLIGQFVEVNLAQEGVIGYPSDFRLCTQVNMEKPLILGFYSKKSDGNI